MEKYRPNAFKVKLVDPKDKHLVYGVLAFNDQVVYFYPRYKIFKSLRDSTVVIKSQEVKQLDLINNHGLLRYYSSIGEISRRLGAMFLFERFNADTITLQVKLKNRKIFQFLIKDTRSENIERLKKYLVNSDFGSEKKIVNKIKSLGKER